MQRSLVFGKHDWPTWGTNAHPVALQWSLVQSVPSSQVSACTQPVAGSQVSSVQARPSSQEIGIPAQAPVG